MVTNFSEIIFCDVPSEYECLAPNGELHIFKYDQIGIDEIRALILESHRKPSEADTGKQIVISANKISSEAQQAALKILEEPPASVKITLVLPIGIQLLPTVLSRVQVQTIKSVDESSSFEDWRNASYVDRLSLIDEKLKAKDMQWMQSFKNGLQQHLNKPHGYSSVILKQLEFVVNEFLTRGASNKMLLEHLALSLPLTVAERK